MGNLDSHRLNHLLFGAYYESDIYDKLCDRFPAAMRAFSWRIEPAFLAARLIFIHVPRAAGMSVAQALGARPQSHYSMRYFRAINPAFAAQAESFAVLRDPIERFRSAYAIVRNGGAERVRLAGVFARATAHIRSVDDYLAFLEERPPLERDHVMRPQCWYVTDLRTGEVLVKRLFLLESDTAQLAAFLRQHGAGPLGWLNRSDPVPLQLTPEQCRRVVALYREDFDLIARLRAMRGHDAAARRQAAE